MNYSKEFKGEALKLSNEIGVKKAAAQLGLKYYKLAGWHSKYKEQLNVPRQMRSSSGESVSWSVRLSSFGVPMIF